MACKKKDLIDGDIISVWFGKGHMPVRGKVVGFTPKYIKAWVKTGNGNIFVREPGATMDDEPKIFYLTEDQVTKVEVNGLNVLKEMGFKEL